VKHDVTHHTSGGHGKGGILFTVKRAAFLPTEEGLWRDDREEKVTSNVSYEAFSGSSVDVSILGQSSSDQLGQNINELFFQAGAPSIENWVSRKMFTTREETRVTNTKGTSNKTHTGGSHTPNRNREDQRSKSIPKKFSQVRRKSTSSRIEKDEYLYYGWQDWGKKGRLELMESAPTGKLYGNSCDFGVGKKSSRV